MRNLSAYTNHILMKRMLLLAAMGLAFTAQAQVQSPEAFLGYPLGSKFTYHHRIVAYYEHVAANSDRVSLEYYGQTNEGRPLLVAYVTSPQNHQNLEQIREDNLKRSRAESPSGGEATQKALVWLSYNVHGNEASSSEATMLTLYTLATDASRSAWLNNSVVIMDPCINPDGRDRYANWYNQVAGSQSNIAHDAWEHNEPWPGGRPNHYLFDLNRDWAWQTQVESQQRMKLYRKWMPHVHVDFHEQGINSPYYFAPAAEPFHEAITQFQREFQTRIGENHARYFDENGWLYFTKEVFDLLYPSYGDTYPTFNGAIGMTYEQAGHGMGGLAVSIEGNDTLTLLDRLTHHHTTGLSTVEVAATNHTELVDNFTRYFSSNANKAQGDYQGYVIPVEGQEDKVNALVSFLRNHEIEVYPRTDGKSIRGFDYQTGRDGSYTMKRGDYYIPGNQPQGAMVRVLMEPRTKLSTNVTYDITAWALPYVYGIKAYGLAEKLGGSDTGEGRVEAAGAPYFDKAGNYGYILPWVDLKDAQVLAGWLAGGLQVRFAEKGFEQANKRYPAGSVIVLRADNPNFSREAFDEALAAPLNKYRRRAYTSNSGWVTKGHDFGSGEVKVLQAPRIAVLGGEGTSSLSYGETWYYFDQILQYPITRIHTADADGVDWSKYDVVVMPEGYYSQGGTEGLVNFVRRGGTLIALGDAVGVLARSEDYGIVRKTAEEEDDDKNPNYAERLQVYGDREGDFLERFNPGSIFEAHLDTSHPLAFGYGNRYFTMRTGGTTYEYLEDGWNVGYLDKGASPRSGYVGKDLLPLMEESLVMGVEDMGRGTVVYLPDNPLFRAFWRNGHLMVANALFFVNK